MPFELSKVNRGPLNAFFSEANNADNNPVIPSHVVVVVVEDNAATQLAIQFNVVLKTSSHSSWKSYDSIIQFHRQYDDELRCKLYL